MEKIANHKADREELSQLINDYEETMEEFNNEVNNIMQNQSSVQQSTSQTLNYHGINIVEPLEVFSDIQAIKTFWSGMVEADSTAKSSFSEAQPDVQQLEKKIIAFLEAIGKDGGKVGSLDVDKLRSAVFEDKGMIESIEEKLENGESLSAAERDLFYQYLQEEVFRKEDHEKMEDISEMMEKGNEEDFKDYINEEVLTTENQLEAEIMFLEMYLFTGDKRPSELNGSDKDRIKWNNYLEVLKNARKDINKTKTVHGWDRTKDDTLFAHVEFIESEFGDNPISGRTQSKITILGNPEQYDGKLSKKEVFESDLHRNIFMEENSNSNVEYFYGSDGISDYSRRKDLDYQDEMDTYTRDYISNELLGVAIGLAPGDKIMSALAAYGGYNEGKRENEKKMTVKKIEDTAREFKLEMHVSEHRAGSVSDIELIPTEKTYDILERWEAVQQVNSSVPYPAEEIDRNDWEALHTYMMGDIDDDEGGFKAEFKNFDEDGNHDRDILDFIMYGDDSDDPTVKDAQKAIDSQ